MLDDQDSDPDWFWGEISRSQANELLQGAPDGSFLVRNSSSNANDLTLTVKKDGVNKMMRILCRNGRYGFREPLLFRSLRALIELHHQQPLTEYNQEMDVCLQNPISKQAVLGELPEDAVEAAVGLAGSATTGVKAGTGSEQHVERLMTLLLKANQDYLMVTQNYDRLFEDYKKSVEDIQTGKKSLEAFNEAIAILEEALHLNETLQQEAMVHEVALMAMHHQAIQTKLRQVQDQRSYFDADLRKILLSSRSLDRQVNELKPQIHEHKRTREQLSALLIHQGVRRELIEVRLEQQVTSSPSDLIADDDNSPGERLDGILATASNCTGGATTNMAGGEASLNYSCLDTEYLARVAQQNRQRSLDEDQLSSLDCFDRSEYKRADELPFERRGSDVSTRDEPSRYRDSITTIMSNKENCDVRNAGDVLLEEPLESQLQRMEWYVGEMSREQINDLLSGSPEGTFLLRDSKQRADAPYTLTVRKDNANKMLRVLQRQGKFGFKEPFEFDSLVQLLRYHMRQPLLVSKSDMVIQLLHPWSSELHRTYCSDPSIPL